MAETKVKAIVKEPGKEAEIKEVIIKLESLQKIVKGMIEIIPFPDIEGLDIILNEEGKLINLDPNILIPEYNDLAVGPIIVLGFDEDKGDHRSLSEEEIKKVKEYIKKNDAREFKGKIEDFLGVDFHIL
ncbi:MAG: hypothetical protein BWX72_00442 [Firmicutes bacterium ADurb.Bin080]|jgi:hypothetical protein|nr:MAG: hypothetical protein BWX72_00442 [Firmicutes bacterium ADurb.Bin080]